MFSRNGLEVWTEQDLIRERGNWRALMSTVMNLHKMQETSCLVEVLLSSQ